MVEFEVRIVRVDHYGYCGRDNHPTDDMVGRTARITKMTTWTTDGVEELDLADTSQNHGDCPFTLFEGVTDDGRRVELVEHEIVLKSLTLPGGRRRG